MIYFWPIYELIEMNLIFIFYIEIRINCVILLNEYETRKWRLMKKNIYSLLIKQVLKLFFWYQKVYHFFMNESSLYLKGLMEKNSRIICIHFQKNKEIQKDCHWWVFKHHFTHTFFNQLKWRILEYIWEVIVNENTI